MAANEQGRFAVVEGAASIAAQAVADLGKAVWPELQLPVDLVLGNDRLRTVDKVCDQGQRLACATSAKKPLEQLGLHSTRST